MGANNSSEVDNQRIAEIATEANGQFAKEFSIAFKDAVINKIKNAYIQSGTKLSLLQADMPCQSIKTGYLLKLGANVKNWKRRKFVAKNEADNYAIVYYEDEQESKEKGRLSCCGYEVVGFSAEESGWYGQFGIKLKSHDDSKRMWLFRAESEDEQRQWMEVFMNACKKSKPEQQRDPVLVEAFTTAYRVTRAAYGYFGVFYIIGTECEMLEYLTNQILSREILDQYISERGARSNSVSRKNLMVSVHNNVQKIIKPIVASSWRSCSSAAEVMKASFELSVKASLRLILDKETEIRIFLQPKVQSLVDPYMSDMQTKTCMPILNCCFLPIVEAYEHALLGLHAELHKCLGSMEFYPETIPKELLRIEELIEGQQAGQVQRPLLNSQRVLWKMHTSDLSAEVLEVFELSGGVSGYDLYVNTMDDLKSLLKNAVHTFGKMLQNPSGLAVLSVSVNNTSSGIIMPPSPPSSVSSDSTAAAMASKKRPLSEVLNEIMSRLTADAKVLLQRGLVSFLAQALEGKVQEMMIAPCYEVSLSAHHLITRETQLMINLNSLGEAMVRDIVSQHLTATLSDLMVEASSRLNMIAVQLMGDSSSS